MLVKDMLSNDTEQIVLLSEAGKPIGAAPKLASHHSNTPLHLAFSAYVFNKKGELLLTRRAKNKKVFPGVWTNSCCGHPAPEESVSDAVARRLGHELGLTPSSIRLALPDYRYRASMNGVVENEICPVYIVGVDDDPKPNNDEVGAWEWISWQDFRHRISLEPNQFSPWCREQSEQLDSIVNSSGKHALRDVIRYKDDVVSGIDRLLESRQRGKWSVDVYKRLGDYLSGGKLLRGCLLCFSHDMFEGDNYEAARVIASCLELLHGALLIHDDIMDQDSMRRGKIAMHEQYAKLSSKPEPEASHFGESMAICTADAAIFIAFRELSSSKIPSSRKDKIIELFGAVLETVCYGQMLDIELGQTTRQPTRAAISTVMEQKTALYSLSLPLMAGALLAGQRSPVVSMLEELGRLVGIIFQIRDDELGVFGDAAKTGKPVGSDIVEGKKTLLYYYLFKKSSASNKKLLLKIFGNQRATESDIEFVRAKMVELNIQEHVDREVHVLAKQAREIIGNLDIAEHNKQNLRELVEYCAVRDV